MTTIYQCSACNRVIRSKSGLTLHRKKCSGTYIAMMYVPETCGDTQTDRLFDLNYQMISDSEKALRFGNKSAAKRARMAALQIRNELIDLRRKLLAVYRP